MRGRNLGFVLCLTVSAVVASAQTSRPASPAGATGWWDDLFADRPARLEDVVASPEAFRGATLRLAVQLRGTSRVAETFHTKFSPEAWLNFAAWADETPLWEDQAFRKSHAYFFVRRDHGEAPLLIEAKPYARFALRVRVAEVLKGEPWIEVLGAAPLPGRMTEAALLRLMKGFQLRDLRRFDAAADEFAAADDADLPVGVRVRALKEKASCLESAGRFKAALTALRKAVETAPEDREVAGLLAALRLRTRAVDAERPVSAADATTPDAGPKPASRPSAPEAPPSRRRDDGD